jgi:hypothetical protein
VTRSVETRVMTFSLLGLEPRAARRQYVVSEIYSL